MTFAIIGAPNSGKSVLFNFLTGLNQKVANYPGCTVIQKTGNLRFAKTHDCIDLPGTYSLHHNSQDASIATEYILQYQQKKIDRFILVCNCTAIQRSLILALQLKELGVPVSLVLNMQDELLLQRGKIDVDFLEQELQMPTFLISATRRWNVMNLVDHLREIIHTHHEDTDTNKTSKAISHDIPPINTLEQEIIRISNRAVLQLSQSHEISDKIDAVLLHPFLGKVILTIFAYIIFQSIFSWATPLMAIISSLFDTLSFYFNAILPQTWISSFITNGVIAGLGSVLVFLPQIIILTFAIGIMEMSGYMARAVFLLDSIFRKIGLQGKVFIPLLTAHACAIPGIMASRTIGNPIDRFITIFITPFMSCSARLPVYTLLITAFIPDYQVWGFISIRTFVLFALYLGGSIIGLLIGWSAKLIYTRTNTSNLNLILDRVAEIPNYRLPTISAISLYVWHRVRMFLKRAGTIILGISIVFWILVNVRLGGMGIEHSLAGILGKFIHPFFAPLGLDWQSSTAVLIGLTAREVFISTVSVLYSAEMAQFSLMELLPQHLSFASGIALLVYYVYAPQCLATFAVMYKETQNLLFTMINFIVMLSIAYGFAKLVYILL